MVYVAKELSRQVLICILIGMLGGSAMAGTEIFAGPFLIGDNTYSECTPQTPEGTVLYLYFNASLSAGGGAQILGFEAMGVAPSLTNTVYLNGHDLGSITCVGADNNCATSAWDDYFTSVELTDYLLDGENVLEIRSGFDGSSNYDDVWIRNIVVDGPVADGVVSWGEIKTQWR